MGALPRHPPAPDRLHHLLCKSEEELLEIQGTQLLSTTMGVKEYVQSEFDNVEAEIISANEDLFPGTITFDDFLWAFGILRSRVFSGLRGDKLALIPFADLVGSLNTNHVDMIKLLIQKAASQLLLLQWAFLQFW